MYNANKKFNFGNNFNKYEAKNEFALKNKKLYIEENKCSFPINSPSTYDSDFSDLDVRVKMLQSKLEEKDKEIQKIKSQYQKKIRQMEEELSKKDQENEEQLKEYKSEKKKINNLNEEISSLKKEINNFNIIISSNEETLKNLKKYDLVKSIDLNKGIPSLSEFMPKYDGKDPLKFYDIIVDINSIKGFVDGWSILKNEKGSIMLKSPDENSIKIGVVGNGNKGKSFILSRISDLELPIGESIKTKGLSIKFPQIENYSNRTITLLDSAGQETPVLNNNKGSLTLNNKEITPNYSSEISKEEELTEKSRDKLLTEFFLQNYIVKYSDLLIIVVGILTFSEQKLINKIKKTFMNLNKKGQLVVIHNLQSYVTLDQVKNYINETLLKSDTFTLKEKFEVSKEMTKGKSNPKFKWSYFYEPKVEPNTIHLIFAREKSEAGNFYNQMGIQHIYDLLNTINEKEPLNLCKNIKDLFVDLSNQILETQINEKDIESNENKISLKLNDNKNELKLKKCSIDELGLNNFSSSGFEPKYCYYIHKNMLNIICEVCGPVKKENFKVNADCENGKCIIKIEGNKINDIAPIEKECQNINMKNREFGKYSFSIVIMDINIDTSHGRLEKADGLIKITYPIKESSSTLTFE